MRKNINNPMFYKAIKTHCQNGLNISYLKNLKSNIRFIAK